MTPLERQVLTRLNNLGHRTAGPFGVNPISFGGPRAAACARRMAAKGWVRLQRMSDTHIRYGLTGEGRLALFQPDASANSPSESECRDGQYADEPNLPLTRAEGGRG